MCATFALKPRLPGGATQRRLPARSKRTSLEGTYERADYRLRFIPHRCAPRNAAPVAALVNAPRHRKRPSDGAPHGRARASRDAAGNGTQYMLVAMAVVEIAGLVYFAFAP